MGLSVAISGGIIIFTMIYVMMEFPALLDDATKISKSSAEMSSTLNSITHTNISYNALSDVHGNSTATIEMKNTGNTILWNYNKFDVIITYTANIPGFPTLTEVLSYVNSCAALAPDKWCISSIATDYIHPGLLDPNEIATIKENLQNPTLQGGTFTLNFGTDNGVVASRTVAIT